MSDDADSKASKLVPADVAAGAKAPVPASVIDVELVQRSTVPAGRPYKEYRSYLRHDFFHSCAYCSMTESESRAIKFTIDHYECQRAHPNLENTYGNLMYSCEPCNTYKGDRCPPQSARDQGHRFFRPDEDRRGEHFALRGYSVEGLTPTGEYSVDALDLNRQTLRRIRELRARIDACVPMVEKGILALRNVAFDQLPAGVRSKAMKARTNAENAEASISEQMDALLRNYARSELIDADESPEELERKRERLKRIKATEGLHPGAWRGRQTTKKR